MSWAVTGRMQRAAVRLRGVDSTIDAGERGFRPIPKDQPQPGASLREIFVFFAAKPSPRIIATTFVVAAVSRLVIGGWGWWDLAIPAAIACRHITLFVVVFRHAPDELSGAEIHIGVVHRMQLVSQPDQALGHGSVHGVLDIQREIAIHLPARRAAHARCG